MDFDKVLREIVESQVIFEVPEFVKIKSIDVELGSQGEKHTATLLTYSENVGEVKYEVTIKEID